MTSSKANREAWAQEVFISGSLAYDRIMDFPGHFSDHILPDKLHMLNLSFTVNSLTEKFGGTAGNIAYALSLLGGKPRIAATIGHDYQPYFQWLERHGIPTGDIRIVSEEPTASAYITTDLADNQITGFNPGAMKHPSRFDFGKIDTAHCLAIVAPGNLQDMVEYTHACQRLGIFCLFDPGQSLPRWEGEELARCIGCSNMLVSNEYELELILSRTGHSPARLLQMVDTIITTKGEQGCQVLTRQGATRIPAIPTERVVDPTGAGDAFRGGLLHGLVQGCPVERAAMMGTACANYAIQSYGTQEYRFTLEEFRAKLERHFGPA